MGFNSAFKGLIIGRRQSKSHVLRRMPKCEVRIVRKIPPMKIKIQLKRNLVLQAKCP